MTTVNYKHFRQRQENGQQRCRIEVEPEKPGYGVRLEVSDGERVLAVVIHRDSWREICTDTCELSSDALKLLDAQKDEIARLREQVRGLTATLKQA